MAESGSKPHPLRSLATDIGNITIAWNDIHFFIYSLFWGMNSENPVNSEAIYFAIKTDRAQRDMTYALASVQLKLWPDLLSEVHSTLDDVNRLAGRRNAVVHAMWMYEAESIHRGEVFAPSSPKLSKKNITQEIQSLQTELSAMLRRIAPLPEKVRATIRPPKLLHSPMLGGLGGLGGFGALQLASLSQEPLPPANFEGLGLLSMLLGSPEQPQPSPESAAPGANPDPDHEPQS